MSNAMLILLTSLSFSLYPQSFLSWQMAKIMSHPLRVLRINRIDNLHLEITSLHLTTTLEIEILLMTLPDSCLLLEAALLLFRLISTAENNLAFWVNLRLSTLILLRKVTNFSMMHLSILISYCCAAKLCG